MDDITNEILIRYGYVKASKYRERVVGVLVEPMTPTEISDCTGIVRNHASNTLRELERNDVISCLNPSSRKGRLYSLTSIGLEVKKMLQSKPRYILAEDGIKDTLTNQTYNNLEDIIDLLNNTQKRW